MNPNLCEHYLLGDGSVTCPWVSQRDARRAVRLFGGSVALAPEACLVEPLPPAPLSPLASGGTDASAPTGSSWTDPESDRWQDPACYVLRSINYWAGSPPAFETTR